ncbi:MAG: hypothetical protein CSA22_05210 [Deltaproteobacteria bacterium]|nr:MAG: hypothetical protein CSA22_05210 [Deltaproteobacteria bacterium]
MIKKNIGTSLKKWEIKNDQNSVGTIVRKFLGKGISISHSKSFSMESMESSVVEKESLANFVFLLSGELDLKHDRCSTWQNMRQSNAYLFFSEDRSNIRRRINAQVSTEALIIKISRNIFHTLMSDVEDSHGLLARGVRYFSKSISAHDIMLCNYLVSCQYKGQIGQMIHMGRSLELVARTFLQGVRDVQSESLIILELTGYIKDHIDQNFSLKALSKMAGMSHTKLNTLFRVHTGFSVFEFIRQERLLRAETYLQYTDMSITQIAYEVGFSSSSHFSESFRRYRGITPGHFRKTLFCH